MRETKLRLLEEARLRAKTEPLFAASLGQILIVGILEIIQAEKFAGTELRHLYTTHFDVPGEGEFQFTIERKETADAR